MFILTFQHFKEPLDIVKYVNSLPAQDNGLRRFCYMPADDESYPAEVECPFKDCHFCAGDIDEMMSHQTEARHPGWGKIPPLPASTSWVCGKCGKGFAKWGVLYPHLRLHSLPFHCEMCQFKAGNMRTLRNHQRNIHNGKELDKPPKWCHG